MVFNMMIQLLIVLLCHLLEGWGGGRGGVGVFKFLFCNVSRYSISYCYLFIYFYFVLKYHVKKRRSKNAVRSVIEYFCIAKC